MLVQGVVNSLSAANDLGRRAGPGRLMRQTLAEMQTHPAAHSFRTHRRALVNRQRMQAILTPDIGESGVRLSSGQVTPLSESRRSEVLRPVLGAKA